MAPLQPADLPALLQDIASKLTDCPGVEPPPLRPEFAQGLNPGQNKAGLTQQLARVAMGTHALDKPPASVNPVDMQAPSFARAFNITLSDMMLQQVPAGPRRASRSCGAKLTGSARIVQVGPAF